VIVNFEITSEFS